MAGSVRQQAVRDWRWGRIARYSAYCATGLIAVVVAAALILPEFLDRPAVRTEIERGLSGALHGEVAWKELSIRFLPSPRGVLQKVQVEIPGIADVSAAEVHVRLRLWPLLRGRAEIVAVSVVRPVIRVDVAAQPGKRKKAKEPPLDPVAIYRSVAGPIADAVRAFAPDTVIEIEDASVDVRVSDMPPMQLTRLSLRAQADSRTLDVEMTTSSNTWSRLKLSARVELADLSGRASLDADEIKPQAWFDTYLSGSPLGIAVPSATLLAQGRTDAKTSLECDFDLRAASVEILSATERVQVPGVVVKGKVAASAQESVIHLSHAELGSSKLAGGTLRYSPGNKAIAGSLAFDLDLAQVLEGTRRLVPEKAGAVLAGFQPVTGRAEGRLKLAFGHAGWSVGADILKSDSSVQMRGLPGPVLLASGSVGIDARSVSVDRAVLAMLDAQARVSAAVSDYRTDRPQAAGVLSEGVVGEKLLAWVGQIAHVPPHLQLKTPIRVAVPRFVWGPKQVLDLQAMARFDAGPAVGVELGWAPKALDIRKVSIKDERSDAVIAVRTVGRLLEGKFSGSLNSTSISAMLKSETLPSGVAAGDLRFTYDRDNPARTSAQGNLKGDALDLTWLFNRPVKIDRIDLAADGSTLRVGEASVSWAGQRATLRGEVKRGDGRPVIDAQLDSPGVDLDALLQAEDKIAKEKPPATPEGSKQPPLDKGKASGPWPLPVTGRIAVRSDFLQYGRHRIAPLSATLALEKQRAHLDLSQAQLCGITLPLTIEATPKGLLASAQITAQKQQLERAAQCLSDQGVLITGDFDLRADLSTQGRLEEFVRNLKGTIGAEARDGKVMKFAMLGNILSTQGVSAVLKQDGPRVDSAGFPYRKIVVDGRFEAGRFIVKEGAFQSDVVGLAATGWISLLDYGSRLTVLVAPFGRLDEFVRDVPILGYVIGGALTSLPVGVSGDIRDPLIVPLGPAAITSELVGIFERTLKLPVKLIKPQ